MSIPMFHKALRDLRWTVAWYACGLMAYALMILAFYPAVEKNMSSFQDMIDKYPKALKDAFGIENYTTLTGFVGGELLNVMWPLIASVFLIVAGTGMVAQEIERGTVELWLSVPASRVHLLASKLLALLIGIAVLCATTGIALGLGARLIGKSLSLGGLLATSVTLLAFCVAVAGYSVLLSSSVSARGKAAGLAAGLTVLSYLAWVVAGLSESWSWLKHVSIFAAYKPQDALEHGTLSPVGVLVLLLLGVGCSIAALVVFQRRDVIA